MKYLTGLLNKVITKIEENYDVAHIITMIILGIFKIIFAVLVYYACLLIIRIVLNSSKKIIDKKVSEKSLGTFFLSLNKVILHIIALYISLLVLGFHESTLLAFFGTLGFGVGLALKDNLSNLAGGLLILFFKIYKIGDEVEINNELGYIHEIDIFATTIRSWNNDLIVVPNNLVVSNKVINYTKTPLRRVKLLVPVAYVSDIDLARQVLEKMLSDHKLILSNLGVSSYVSEYGSSSISLAIMGWTTNENYWTVYIDSMNEIKKTLDENGIKIPYPQLDVHFDKEELKQKRGS